ncbi:MAG TPA: valine--tRNA ligase [Methylomirabilota bacterium]|nr:valine--tRNA ligase [Methylomirabilota bacterium]
MTREIAKAYEPQKIEPRWADYWVKEELFRADPSAPGPAFCIVIPPPNVTGSLHIGHMLDHTEIDILTRWRRMSGYNTLYLPGTDHAGISTQRVVVRQLADQGIDYRKLGREEFEKRVWKWKEESGGTIIRQMKQIGESCDWSRERFTLSPELSRVVRDVFVRLYEEGLIYRAHYLVNWCPNCMTALSDLETLHEERQGHLWYIRYPILGSNEHIVVATTRPETMLGDTAILVHPADERYAGLVGKKAILPLVGREIPIIADDVVDREFGTGAVKVTPAHDPNDFEAGRRHDLPEIDVMTDDGRMGAAAGGYAGMDRFEARKRVLEDLKKQGLLENITNHVHAVGICERCKTVVEPRASTQWFCRMKPLAEPAIAAVENGEIQIIPANWREVYFHWMRNIRDWCISRQLWWGHRIPAWHCADCGKITVAREAPAKCAHCGSAKIEQDPDVLDTWFSSALWPFSTLGWPAETADFKRYYPTSVLITAHEILFFWVARMIMMGIHFTGKIPFHDVSIHPLVRNAEGQKMSKSKGTGIDPIDVNQRYGTDAMRFTLAAMAAPGGDLIWTEDRIVSARNFANKIWNAARFLFVNFEKVAAGGASLDELATPEMRAGAPYGANGDLALADAWLFSRLSAASKGVNEALEEYRFQQAAQSVYHFFWDDFCDWYIEWIKPDLAGPDGTRAKTAWKNLFAVFETALRLLHPFMPFLTEELWHQLPQRAGARSIAFERFPAAKAEWGNAEAEEQFAYLQDVVTALRDMRAGLKLDPKKKVAAQFSSEGKAWRDLVQRNLPTLLRLAVLSELSIGSERLPTAGGLVRSVLAKFEVRIALSEGLDIAAEARKLRKEIERLEKDIAAKRQRLDDDTFRTKAPESIVKGLEATLAERVLEREKLMTRFSQLEQGG